MINELAGLFKSANLVTGWVVLSFFLLFGLWKLFKYGIDLIREISKDNKENAEKFSRAIEESTRMLTDSFNKSNQLSEEVSRIAKENQMNIAETKETLKKIEAVANEALHNQEQSFRNQDDLKRMIDKLEGK